MAKREWAECEGCHDIVDANKTHRCLWQEWCRRCGEHRNGRSHRLPSMGSLRHAFEGSLRLKSSSVYIATNHKTEFLVDWKAGTLTVSHDHRKIATFHL